MAKRKEKPETTQYMEIEKRAKTINDIFAERDNGLTVEFTRVWKNNVEKAAFTIRSEDYNACPTVYPDELMLELGDDELADRLEDFHRHHARNVSLDAIMDREYILEHVRPRKQLARITESRIS